MWPPTQNTELRTQNVELKQKIPLLRDCFYGCGESGIRTPGGLHLNSFQDCRNRPLCQLSGAKIDEGFHVLKYFKKYSNLQERPIYLTSKSSAMSTVHKILEKKRKTPFTIHPDISVYDALQKMMDNNIGALIVMRGDTFIGLFTERDYARKVVLKERTSRETQINEIMDENCELVSSNTLIKDCMNIMTENSIRYLPVLDDNKLTGIISIGDVVKYIIEDQQFTLSQLENYINDSR